MSPSLLSPGLARDIERAKVDAAERRRIEEAMPAGLRYVSGWPQRMPTWNEAIAIGDARRPILVRHGLDDEFTNPDAIMVRFDELIIERDRKAAAKAKKGARA